MTAFAALLARRNLRRGRGDPRGALRLVGLVVAGAWAAWRSLGEEPDLGAWLDAERR